MSEIGIIKEADLSWYKSYIRSIWDMESSSPHIDYSYDHPFWLYVADCIKSARLCSDSKLSIFRSMATKLIVDYIDEAWFCIYNKVIDSFQREITLNQICREAHSRREIEVVWSACATFLRWNCYTEKELDVLYYDQRIFARDDAPQVTIDIYREFMEQWRLLLNKKVDDLVSQELDMLVLVPPEEDDYYEDDEDDEEDGEDDDDGGISFEGEYLRDMPYTSADFFKRQEIYRENFSHIVNVELYDKYKSDIRRIANKLGRVSNEEEEKSPIGNMLKFSFPCPPYEDIEGVSSGNRLKDMLPSELAVMSIPDTEILFYQKFASKQLQLFSCFPREGGRATKREKGPIIISIDTSFSMDGDPLDFARLVVLDVYSIAKREKRPLFVIRFSVEADCIELSGEEGEVALMDFLVDRSAGGSDPEEMLKAILKQLDNGEYQNADTLIVSDFQLEHCPHYLGEAIKSAQKNGTRFYAINTLPGDMPPEYESLLNKIWEIRLCPTNA